VGSVTIEALFNDSKNRILIKVIDTGVGIEHHRLEGLFTAFTKIMRYRELNQEGVGLGLTISKNLAVALGGDVSVASEIGVGTTFTVELPARGLTETITPNSRADSSG
jgi:signal transduction histidine kinase